MDRVIVGLSGGVDSAVAAYLLKEEGYDVTGATLRTWKDEYGAFSRCCEIDDAKQIAANIGIPYHVADCSGDFSLLVTKPFMESYVSGLTPNPCVVCNRVLKWAKMLEVAKKFGADYVATGHYASVVKLDNGRYTVRMAENAAKDQTYMLYNLTQQQLACTLMPLGDMSKDEVRSIAASANIPVADKPDSQEICFVPDDDYAGYINENYNGYIPGEGDFVDEDGNVLGRHNGIIHYTVGQRKGLGLPLGYPIYVKRIDAIRNEVILAKDEALYSNTVMCRDINYMGIERLCKGDAVRCRAKIRYRHAPADTVAELIEDGTVRLTFDEPVRAAAPGQAAVMYDDNGCVMAGGTII